MDQGTWDKFLKKKNVASMISSSDGAKAALKIFLTHPVDVGPFIYSHLAEKLHQRFAAELEGDLAH